MTIAALVLLSLAAFAQSAPAQLHGKSIVATWSENRMQRLAGKGEFRPMSIPSGISVYVSTAGRMFVRRFAAGRGGAAGRESLGAGSSAAGAHASAFRGRSLNVTASFMGGGARAINIAFDEGFSTCTAQVVIGREAGAANMRMKTFAGDYVEIQSISAGAATCTIRDGNIFAN